MAHYNPISHVAFCLKQRSGDSNSNHRQRASSETPGTTVRAGRLGSRLMRVSRSGPTVSVLLDGDVGAGNARGVGSVDDDRAVANEGSAGVLEGEVEVGVVLLVGCKMLEFVTFLRDIEVIPVLLAGIFPNLPARSPTSQVSGFSAKQGTT